MGSGAFLVETCRQLGDEVIKAWYAHDAVPTDIPPDEDEVLYARRLVAQRCLYGVDKNDMAVDLAKLSPWLVTLAKDHAFTFLDHALRHGDSLVGLTRRQIIGFHWEPKKQKQFGEDLIQKRLDRATEARAKILNAREDVPYRDQEQRLAVADEALNVVRMTGDACVSAFFAGSKKKQREDRCEELFGAVSDWYASSFDPRKRVPIADAVASLRGAPTHQSLAPNLQPEHPIPAFHWEIEFPEVFARENGGFDTFVGNPPFLGGLLISELSAGPEYLEWLKTVNEAAFKNADLSAYFFRQVYDHINDRGTIGLLATKTISEGDTRTAGLQPIVAQVGRIYNAIRSMPWPGEAAVLVACVFVAAKNAALAEDAILDGRRVRVINSRLHSSAEVADPVSLAANDQKGFYGTNLLGIGFVLTDDEYAELYAESRNRECIYPYLGGQEVNKSPTQSHDRHVISFGSEPFEHAEQFPQLLEIVRDRVKPERDKAPNHGPGNHGRKYWWQHGLRADPLYRAIDGHAQCLVSAISTTHLAFSLQSTRQILAHSLVVFAFDNFSPFTCLQSRIHFAWACYLSSSLWTALRYSVRDAFQTFPFPEDYNSNEDLESHGSDYYKFRAEIMVRNGEGLTQTYNRFHDPHEQSEGILELRRLHSLMDGAVLRAYGWDDLAESARCEFLLDDEEEMGDGDLGLGIRDWGKNQSPVPKPSIPPPQATPLALPLARRIPRRSPRPPPRTQRKTL